MKISRSIMLYDAANICEALDELKAQGLSLTYIAKQAITQYIKANYPDLALKHKL